MSVMCTCNRKMREAPHPQLFIIILLYMDVVTCHLPTDTRTGIRWLQKIRVRVKTRV